MAARVQKKLLKSGGKAATAGLISKATVPTTRKGPAAQARAQKEASEGAAAFAALLQKHALSAAPKEATPLSSMPTFGPRSVKMLQDLGFKALSPKLAAQDPEKLYARLLKKGGYDKKPLGPGGPCRCVLGSLRCAVYYARVPPEMREIHGGWPDFMDKRVVALL